MATKTFHAPNMLSALQEVQRELGPSAVVLSMRQVTKGPFWAIWRKPGCEVIASDDAKKGNGQPLVLPPALKGKTETRPFVPEPFDTQQSRLREGHLALAPQPKTDPPAAAQASSASPTRLPASLVEMRRFLLSQGLEESLVKRLLANCLQVLNPTLLEGRDCLKRYVRLQLEAGLKACSRSMALVPNRVICLVGPNGSGKTATCAKLATFFTLSLGKKVVWVAADTVRAAAIAEARVFTDTLGIPLELAYTPDELSRAIEDHPEADLFLIDTPGCNPRRENQVLELGGLLTRLPQRATYLIAPATTRDAALNQCLAAFGAFNLKGLVITHLDEAASFGDIYNFATRSMLPLLYFTSGNQVMGDLYPGEPERLVAALMDGGVTR